MTSADSQPVPAQPSLRREPAPVGLKSWIGHRGRELLLHLRRLGKRGDRPGVVFFPSTNQTDGSSKFRAYELAAALEPLGWRTLVVPAQLERSQRQRVLDMEQPRILVIQKGRNPLNWPDLYRTDAKIVFDLDDADYAVPDQAEQCAACAEAASLVLAGSRNVAGWCARYNARTQVVWTGHPVPQARSPLRHMSRRPVLAWAQGDSMGYPDEAALVREIVLGVDKPEGFEFWLYGLRGPGQADAYLRPIIDAGVKVRTFQFMPYTQFVESLHPAAVGLHVLSGQQAFSQGKSFGKVLSYLCAEVAVVASRAGENPHFFEHESSAMLCGSDPREWIRATNQLLASAPLRQMLVDNAHGAFLRRLAMPAIARQVSDLFHALLEGRDALLRTPADVLHLAQAADHAPHGLAMAPGPVRASA